MLESFMSAGVFEQKKKSVKFNGQGERERKEEKVLYGEQGTHKGSSEGVLQEEKKGGLRIYSGTREDNQVRLGQACYCSTCMNLLSEINKSHSVLGGIIQKDLPTSDKNTTQKSE